VLDAIKKGGVLLLLHLLLVFYSIAGIMSKFAGFSEPFSLAFFAYYLLVLVILVIYAFGWQQVLKHLPLTTAFANRAITVIWGIIWGVVVFDESVSFGKVVGALLIIVGIFIFSKTEKKNAQQG